MKKRRGVGSRSIAVLDSDEEDPTPKAPIDYARVTKTQVGTSGKVKRVTTSSVPIFEVEEVSVHAPPEVDTNNLENAPADDIPRPAPAKKRRKRSNDSVSYLTPCSLLSH